MQPVSAGSVLAKCQMHETLRNHKNKRRGDSERNALAPSRSGAETVGGWRSSGYGGGHYGTRQLFLHFPLFESGRGGSAEVRPVSGGGAYRWLSQRRKSKPNILRHSKAMHLLQAGVNLIYIRDFLGHVHVETTEIYVRADTETKRKAIERVQIQTDADLPEWTDDRNLMAMLTSLCGGD